MNAFSVDLSLSIFIMREPTYRSVLKGEDGIA